MELTLRDKVEKIERYLREQVRDREGMFFVVEAGEASLEYYRGYSPREYSSLDIRIGITDIQINVYDNFVDSVEISGGEDLGMTDFIRAMGILYEQLEQNKLKVREND